MDVELRTNLEIERDRLESELGELMMVQLKTLEELDEKDELILLSTTPLLQRVFVPTLVTMLLRAARKGLEKD